MSGIILCSHQLIYSMELSKTIMHQAKILPKYEPFYTRQAAKKVMDVLNHFQIPYKVPSNDQIIVTDPTHYTSSLLKARQQLKQENFFLARPHFLDHTITIKVDLQNEPHGNVDLVKLAGLCDNPVQFMIDHEPYWSSNKHTAVALLTQKEHLTMPVVMSIIEELLQEDKADYATRKEALLGLGRALSIPPLKEKAKTLLLKYAQFDDYKYITYHALREIACHQLESVRDEPDVKKVLETIAQTDSRIPLRFKVANILDGLAYAEERLDIELLKHMIASFNVEQLTVHEGMTLDYILWNNQHYSSRVVRGLGESSLALPLVKSFLNKRATVPVICMTDFRGLIPIGGGAVSETVPLYSILKFIGAMTTEQFCFSRIVEALVTVCKGHDLGVLESLEQVLSRLNMNTAVTMPEGITVDSSCKYSNRSACARLSEDTQHKEYERKKVHALIDILKNKKNDVPLAKVAIRRYVQYFFPEKKQYWIQQEYAEYANQMYPYLEYLKNDKSVYQDVQDEAKKIMRLLK